MNHIKAVLWGLGVWAFAFVVSFLIFPFHENQRPLFESIMPVALVLATTFAVLKYFSKEKKRTPWTGFCLGLIWLGVNLMLDGLMFSWGPMKMTLSTYIQDIGLTYLLIPIITTGFGAVKTK